MGTLGSGISEDDDQHLDISSPIWRVSALADGLERYAVKVNIPNNDKGHPISTVAITIASERIPGLDQPYQTCKIGGIITAGADQVNRLAVMSGLLLHIQLFCQEHEIKHLATDNQGDDFAARFLTLAGFKRCACRLPGLVNDGSQLCLPFAVLQTRAGEQPKEVGIVRFVDNDIGFLPSEHSREQIVTKDTQSCGQITTHENNEQTLRGAQKSQPNPMSTPKESSEIRGNAHGNNKQILNEVKVSQPKGISAPKETSEDQSDTHRENEQALREAQISQSKRMWTPKNYDSNATTDSDEVEVISFRSLTKGPVKGSPPIKTEPGLASVPQTANTDEAQARIDKIIHDSTFAPPHSRNSIATPGTLGKKEYCTYYLRTGKCDYMQIGCKYKHEYPQDEETLGKLTQTPYYQTPQTPGVLGKKEYCTYYLRTGMCDYMQEGCRYKHRYPEDEETRRKLNLRKLPRWLEERQAQAFMDRNQTFMDGNNSANVGVRVKAELDGFLARGSDDHLRRSSGYDQSFRAGSQSRAPRKRSYESSGSGSENTVKNEYAAGEFGHLNDRRTAKNSRYSDQYAPQSRDREERARSFHSESSSNASHVTSQNGGVMLGRYQVEAPKPRRAFGGRDFAEEGTLDGEALRAPRSGREGDVNQGTIGYGRGRYTGRGRGH